MKKASDLFGQQEKLTHASLFDQRETAAQFQVRLNFRVRSKRDSDMSSIRSL